MEIKNIKTILILGDINLGSEFDNSNLNRSLKNYMIQIFLKMLNYYLTIIL